MLCLNKVKMSKDKAEVYEKIVSFKWLVIVIIVFRRFLRIYYLMQGICSKF